MVRGALVVLHEVQQCGGRTALFWLGSLESAAHGKGMRT